MRQVSAEMLQAMLAQQTSEVLLSFLKVEHASLAEPQLLVCNTQPIVRADGTYQPFAFDAPSPADKEERIPQTQITIDNTDMTLGQILRTLTGDAPTVTLFTALASSPDTIEEGPYIFELQAATGDQNSITGTLGYDSRLFDQQIPAQSYTPVNSPGLFT